MSDYPLVEVEWSDAWWDPDEISRSQFKTGYPVYTVGYLIDDEEEDVIHVAQESLEDDGLFRAVTHIPRPLVQEIIELSRKGPIEPESAEPEPTFRKLEGS